MVALVLLALLLPRAVAMAQSDTCQGALVIVEGGQPSPFVLPNNEGGTLRVEPDAVLLISAEDIPPDASVRWSVAGFGTDIATVTRDLSAGDVRVELADFSSHVRGLFKINSTLIAGAKEVCSVSFRVRVEGFGGTVATVATAVSAVGGVGSLASAPFTASGMNAKLSAKVKLQRRRPRGWRRVVPLPAWKRTIISTVVGAFTGLGAAVLLQQTGVTPLSLASGIWGLITGGGVTFGVSYSLGALWTYIKPPQEPQDAAS